MPDIFHPLSSHLGLERWLTAPQIHMISSTPSMNASSESIIQSSFQDTGPSDFTIYSASTSTQGQQSSSN